MGRGCTARGHSAAVPSRLPSAGSDQFRERDTTAGKLWLGPVDVQALPTVPDGGSLHRGSGQALAVQRQEVRCRHADPIDQLGDVPVLPMCQGRDRDARQPAAELVPGLAQQVPGEAVARALEHGRVDLQASPARGWPRLQRRLRAALATSGLLPEGATTDPLLHHAEPPLRAERHAGAAGRKQLKEMASAPPAWAGPHAPDQGPRAAAIAFTDLGPKDPAMCASERRRSRGLDALPNCVPGVSPGRRWLLHPRTAHVASQVSHASRLPWPRPARQAGPPFTQERQKDPWSLSERAVRRASPGP